MWPTSPSLTAHLLVHLSFFLSKHFFSPALTFLRSSRGFPRRRSSFSPVTSNRARASFRGMLSTLFATIKYDVLFTSSQLLSSSLARDSLSPSSSRSCRRYNDATVDAAAVVVERNELRQAVQLGVASSRLFSSLSDVHVTTVADGNEGSERTSERTLLLPPSIN